MVAATVAISSAVIASNSAAISSSQNNQAKEARCLIIEKDFNSKLATIEQKKEYSECIDYLYPQPMSEKDMLIAKGVVLSLIIVFVGVAIYNFFSDGFCNRDFFGSIFTSVAFTLGFALLIAVIGAAICFLMS